MAVQLHEQLTETFDSSLLSVEFEPAHTAF